MLSVIMLSVIMLSVIMLSVIMLSVIMLNVVMLIVLAPKPHPPPPPAQNHKRFEFFLQISTNSIFETKIQWIRANLGFAKEAYQGQTPGACFIKHYKFVKYGF